MIFRLGSSIASLHFPKWRGFRPFFHRSKSDLPKTRVRVWAVGYACFTLVTTL